MIVKNNPTISNWNLEHGYDKASDHDYPFRATDAGPDHGLELILSSNKQDHDSMCTAYHRGFKVIFNVPGELSPPGEEYEVQPLEDNSVALQPILTYHSEDLRNYAPSERKCYYQSEEQPLRFFQHYLENNCLKECYSNLIKQECGCVRFSSPSICS